MVHRGLPKEGVALGAVFAVGAVYGLSARPALAGALTALGTVGAATAAVGIAVWGEKNRRRSELSSQLANAWSVVTIPHPFGDGQQGESVEILNGSSEPILLVHIVSGEADFLGSVNWYMHHTASDVTAIKAGDSAILPGHWMVPSGSSLPMAALHSIHYVIQWTDTRGQRWERDGTQTPHPISHSR